MPDNLTRILVEVKERASIVEYVQYEPFYEVLYTSIQSIYYDTKENRALVRMIRSAFSSYMTMTRKMATDLLATLDLVDNPDHLIDLICANLVLETNDAQRILQETDVEKRLMITYEVLVAELEMLRIEQNIDERVKSELDKNQREYVLREQIKVIQEELGENDVIDQIEDYRMRLAKLTVSEEVFEKVNNEINRL
ncbi:MAG: LON peptidase substrate-binding domain-containing protein, partial [Eubacterium sp.]